MGNAEPNSTENKPIKKEKLSSSVIESSLSSNVLLFGYTNQFNNCYINSVLQSLMNINSFREIFLQSTIKLDNNIVTKMLFDLVYHIDIYSVECLQKRKRIDTKIYTDPILTAIKKTNIVFNNNNHHDAHEFLNWLLDYLHEFFLSYYTKINKEDRIINESPISKIFMGSQINLTKCLNCELTNIRKEQFLHIALDIDSNVSITSCLKKYTQKELMKNKDKVYCDNCNNHLEAERNLYLDELPQILIIQLKRFKIKNESLKKLSYCVNFPFELNLKHVMSDAVNNKDSSNSINQSNQEKKLLKDKSTYFKLNSIIVHTGEGMNQGHYFTIIRKDGCWYKLDDETRKNISVDKIKEYMGNVDENNHMNSNSCAYLLFYEKLQ